MTNNREQEALAAYLKLLKNKGVSEVSLKRREEILLQLFGLIETLECDGSTYRESVETLLEGIDKSEWPFSVAVAREYFHFWVQDFKFIAALSSDVGFDIDPIDWMPPEHDLQSLWERLDNEKFEVCETWPLKAYTLALRQEGAEQKLVDIRVKLVKLLLMRLRDAPDKTSKHYRIAVDATVPLFARKETRRLFFGIVREFYYFWIGDPEAAQHIVLATNPVSYV
ncbi:hypothetical protein MTYP_02605 [Methylophilaceae bacterium]|nr:hypothetical protein MTYP_02605 [Methylophilaceae bacterium]